MTGKLAGLKNTHWFLPLADAKRMIDAWRRDHTEYRPYMSLAWLTLAELALSAEVNLAR